MRILLFTISILSCSQLFSQVTITAGKPYPNLGLSLNYFRKGNYVVALKWDGKKPTLQQYDVTSLTQKRVLSYDDFPKKFETQRILKIGQSLYLIYSVKEKYAISFFARKIDIERGEFVDAGRKIAEIQDAVADDIGGSYSPWSPAFAVEHGQFQIYTSTDTSKLAICYRVQPKGSNPSTKFEENGVWIFDSSLTEEWHGTIAMPYSEKKMDIWRRAIDSKGNFYFFISKFNDDTTQKKKGGLPNYSLEVLSFNPSSSKLLTTPIEFKNKFFHSVMFGEYSGGMMCFGYYNSGKDVPLFVQRNGQQDVGGVFALTLYGDGTHSRIIMHEIPIEVINEGETQSVQEKNLKKSEKELVEFPFLSLHGYTITKDGGIIISGESQFYISGQNGNTYFCFNDGLFVKILPDGKLGWIKKMRKEQGGSSISRGKSYRYLGRHGSIHNFLYIDSESNINLKPGESVKEYSDDISADGMLVLWCLNEETGEVKKQFLTDMGNTNGLHFYEFYTHRVVPIDKMSFIFEAELRTVKPFSTTGQEMKQGILVKVEIKE